MLTDVQLLLLLQRIAFYVSFKKRIVIVVPVIKCLESRHSDSSKKPGRQIPTVVTMTFKDHFPNRFIIYYKVTNNTVYTTDSLVLCLLTIKNTNYEYIVFIQQYFSL